MDLRLSRRGLLQTAAVASTLLTAAGRSAALPKIRRVGHTSGAIQGKLTGAQVAVAALRQNGARCVFGIPGAQENELWDAFKSDNFPYLLVTHEFSAACMADGYARGTGCPGVISVVPGPG